LLSYKIKSVLSIIGILIIFITFGLNHYLVRETRKDARSQIEQITKIYSERVNSSSVEELTIIMDVLLPSITFPLIITTNDEIYAIRNLELNINKNDLNYSSEISKIIKRMDSYFDPIPIEWSPNNISLIHYGDPTIIEKIQWIPYIQLGLLLIFILLIFFSLLLIGNREKDKLWVAMTKETAHQLGTPISSLLGWVSLLKEEHKIDKNIINSINLDLKRLNEITDRFYKIGSKPKMSEIDLLDLSNKISNYIKNRIPKKLNIKIIVIGDHSFVMGAETLLGWAIENLLKNSIDACKNNKGLIEINLSNEKKYVNLDIKDNGMGIHKSYWKKIFDAGFSKKKKGWGLGLSLTKRIIENIHNGKIYVVDSSVNETTIRMKLPFYSKQS